jgi:hypothetical protein
VSVRAEAHNAEALTQSLPRARWSLDLPEVTRWSGEYERNRAPGPQAHILLGAPVVVAGIRITSVCSSATHIGWSFSSRLVGAAETATAYSVYSYFSRSNTGNIRIGLRAQAIKRRPRSRSCADSRCSGTRTQSGGQAPSSADFLRIDSNRKIRDYLALIGFMACH